MTKTKRVPGKRLISALEYGQSCQQPPVVQAEEKSAFTHKPRFSPVARSGHPAFPLMVTHNKIEDRREEAKASLSILATEGAFQFSSGLVVNSQPVQISKKTKGGSCE